MNCDSLTLAEVEELVSVQLAEAQRRSVSPSLPAICTIEPYRDGATEAQKKCHTMNTMVMLAKWLHCSTQQDPAACFDGVCAEYEEDVDACYAA